jgi:hypothetical protein
LKTKISPEDTLVSPSSDSRRVVLPLPTGPIMTVIPLCLKLQVQESMNGLLLLPPPPVSLLMILDFLLLMLLRSLLLGLVVMLLLLLLLPSPGLPIGM